MWLDAHEPKTGPERVFVSHAHSDHIAPHREIILSEPTRRLMQARMPGLRNEHSLEFGQSRTFAHQGREYRLTLLPAGHIFGSAMALVEAEAGSLLYTGDFKLRPGLSAEACEPRHADLLVMETTFGRPEYVFPPNEEVMAGVVRFCREALDNDEVPVLLGYSLGKSQELICGLSQARLPLMVHPEVFRLTKIYEQFGRCFPAYEVYQAGTTGGKVLLCPPHAAHSAMLRQLGRKRTAVLTGWAVDANCRYRYQCDAAFPLSDHADFPDLLEMVNQVAPKQVYTLHGFAADFAQVLRHRGIRAQTLSQDEQFSLNLGLETSTARKGPSSPNAGQKASLTIAEAPEASANRAGEFFHGFSHTCAEIARNPGKLQKTTILAEYLHRLDPGDLESVANWFSGRAFAARENRVLQVGWAALRQALCAVTNLDEATFHQVYLKHSDLGETAGELLGRSARQPLLTLSQVRALLESLHAAKGPLGKVPLLSAALGKANALEAKFLVKIITGDLRIGLKEGLVEEAIAEAFGKSAEEVRQAHLLVGDIGETALLAAENRLNTAGVTPFRPVRFMLASPEETAAQVWERVCGEAESGTPEIVTSGAPGPAASHPTLWLEDKYDGIRCQFHKSGGRIALFSRDLKDITATFPELADAGRSLGPDCILDGEILAMRGEQVLPFSELQKRLGRREPDLFLREEIPIRYVAFDILWIDGHTLLNQPLEERRGILERVAGQAEWLRLARLVRVRSVGEIERAFEEARARGNEGLLIKLPQSPYKPGRRGLAWLKLKKPGATLDCVVVGAEFGHGKRSKVLSDYTFAVKDSETGELKTIGKAYTGLTDAEIASLTEHFLKTAIRQRGRFFEVPPDTVLEVAFDRIQPSNRHSSGLALRFPRILRLRPDKSVAEVDTLAAAQRIAAAMLR